MAEKGIHSKDGRKRLKRRFSTLTTSDKLNTALVILWSAAAALVILTVVVVFFPPAAPGPVASPIGTTSTAIGESATSTAPTSTIANATSTTSTSTVVSTQPGEYASDYSAPYPVSWQDGGAQFSVTGASLQGNELTLTLAIQMGGAPACVPLDIRLVADESGTMETPDAPAGGTFTFPDTQSCNGAPGELYSATVSFNVSSVAATPYLLTSGGAANEYFFAATSTDGGIDISLPSTQG